MLHRAPIRTQANCRVRAADLGRPFTDGGPAQEGLLDTMSDDRVRPAHGSVSHLDQVQHEPRLSQPRIFKPKAAFQAPGTEPEMISGKPTAVAHWLVLIALVEDGIHPCPQRATLHECRR